MKCNLLWSVGFTLLILILNAVLTGQTVTGERVSRNAFQTTSAPFGQKQHLLKVSAHKDGTAAARCELCVKDRKELSH